MPVTVPEFRTDVPVSVPAPAWRQLKILLIQLYLYAIKHLRIVSNVTTASQGQEITSMKEQQNKENIVEIYQTQQTKLIYVYLLQPTGNRAEVGN